VIILSDISELRYRIASLLYKNEEDENEALHGYSEFLRELTGLYDGLNDGDVRKLIEKAIDVVREICTDEKNHRLNLQALEYEFEKIPISPDGIAPVLNEIVNSVEGSG
jgi:hypothetical protein